MNIKSIDLICLLLFIGCMGKSAQIGLHIWLPDAMEGPTPVSALIHAATMVTAGVFLLARCSYLFEFSPNILSFIAIIGGITCLFAAIIALGQSDIKKIIAYSTCSQLGYMFMACGFSAYGAGIFHLVTHAFFKALLFLSAGNVIHAIHHEQNIFKMGGLKNKMPITYSNFWLGSLAIIGIYPFAGFYSKDLILELVYNGGDLGHIIYYIGNITAVLTAIYSMKIIFLVFHGETRLTREQFDHAHESPKIMNLPLSVLTIGSLFTGMIGFYFCGINGNDSFFANSIFKMNNQDNHLSAHSIIEFMPLISGIIGMLIGTCIYWNYDFNKNKYNLLKIIFKPIQLLIINKFYIDELYDLLLKKVTYKISNMMNYIDTKIVDQFGPQNIQNAAMRLSGVVSKIQTGYISNYVLVMSFAIVICLSIFIVHFAKLM